MDVPLTPLVVDVVTFDRAPLGRRGYHEDQVDDFLDRVQATLAGQDNLTAHEVRSVEFDAAPFIRRGYHEDQVDQFLDLVVEELERREGTSGAVPAAEGGLPWSRPGTGTGAAGPNGARPGGGPSTPPGAGSAAPGGAPATNTPPGATPNPAFAPGVPAPGSAAASAANPPSGSHTPGATSAYAPATSTTGTRANPVSGNAPGANAPARGTGDFSPGGHAASGPDPVAWLPFPPPQPRPVPPVTPAEQTNPMLFAQPPSWPAPSTQPLKREAAASGPPESSVGATTDRTGTVAEAKPDESPTRAESASVAAGQAASALRTGSTSDMVEEPRPGSLAAPKRTLADYAPKQPPAEQPSATSPETAPPAAAPETGSGTALPFPPAAPGAPGYAPSDVVRLMKLLTTGPDREQLASLTFGLTTTGGYHTGAVDALRQAWLDALPTKQP